MNHHNKKKHADNEWGYNEEEVGISDSIDNQTRADSIGNAYEHFLYC